MDDCKVRAAQTLAGSSTMLGTMAPNDKSRGHVEFIDGHEYLKLPDGNVIRAKTADPIGNDGRRSGQACDAR